MMGARLGCAVEVAVGISVDVEGIVGERVSVGDVCMACGLQAARAKSDSKNRIILKGISNHGGAVKQLNKETDRQAHK
jgi:hypothetical protein